jgi:hypothetical protein
MGFKNLEEYGIKTARTGSLRSIQNVGLNAVTVDASRNPYFFLFSDIDTKEPETLRLVLQKFLRKGISAYFWETSKGWNVVSPNLLDIRQWTLLRLDLQDIAKYNFDTIRWSTRLGDGDKLYFEDSHLQRYLESVTLHKKIAEKFSTEPLDRGIETALTWCSYNQIVFKQGFLRK